MGSENNSFSENQRFRTPASFQLPFPVVMGLNNQETPTQFYLVPFWPTQDQSANESIPQLAPFEKSHVSGSIREYPPAKILEESIAAGKDEGYEEEDREPLFDEEERIEPVMKKYCSNNISIMSQHKGDVNIGLDALCTAAETLRDPAAKPVSATEPQIQKSRTIFNSPRGFSRWTITEEIILRGVNCDCSLFLGTHGSWEKILECYNIAVGRYNKRHQTSLSLSRTVFSLKKHFKLIYHAMEDEEAKIGEVDDPQCKWYALYHEKWMSPEFNQNQSLLAYKDVLKFKGL